MRRHRIQYVAEVSVLVLILTGCGSATVSYPNRLVGADGQVFVVEDLESIANDPDLDEEGKRQAFRELGIEDEELIDELLNL